MTNNICNCKLIHRIMNFMLRNKNYALSTLAT